MRKTVQVDPKNLEKVFPAILKKAKEQLDIASYECLVQKFAVDVVGALMNHTPPITTGMVNGKKYNKRGTIPKDYYQRQVIDLSKYIDNSFVIKDSKKFVIVNPEKENYFKDLLALPHLTDNQRQFISSFKFKATPFQREQNRAKRYGFQGIKNFSNLTLTDKKMIRAGYKYKILFISKHSRASEKSAAVAYARTLQAAKKMQIISTRGLYKYFWAAAAESAGLRKLGLSNALTSGSKKGILSSLKHYSGRLETNKDGSHVLISHSGTDKTDELTDVKRLKLKPLSKDVLNRDDSLELSVYGPNQGIDGIVKQHLNRNNPELVLSPTWNSKRRKKSDISKIIRDCKTIEWARKTVTSELKYYQNYINKRVAKLLAEEIQRNNL